MSTITEDLLSNALDITVGLIKAYPKSKGRRLPIKELLGKLTNIMNDRVTAWASTLVLSSIGLELGTFLLTQTKDIVALAGCYAPRESSVKDEKVPLFTLFSPRVENSASLHRLSTTYLATGLPTDNIEVYVTKLFNGDWEFATIAMVFCESLEESAGVDVGYKVVSDSEMRQIVQEYLNEGYTLHEESGNPMEVPLDQYLREYDW